MSILTKEQLESISRQMYLKARDIDVALWNAILYPEEKNFVIDCLYMYQNKDGGFGHGLEIDNYNPDSSVYQTYEALRMLSDASFDSKDSSEMLSALLHKTFNYLFNRNPLIDGKWNPVVLSNNDHAHSAKYSYTADVFDRFGIHPTAAILGYLFLLVPKDAVFFRKGKKMIPSMTEEILAKEDFTEEELISLNVFYRGLKVHHFPESEPVEEKLRSVLENKAKKNENINYPRCCLELDSSPVLKQKIEEYFTEMIHSLPAHALWEKETSWQTSYPEEESAKLKWLGAITVQNLYLLKKYDKLEK